jgi:uncharacterized membrane-anchored protein
LNQNSKAARRLDGTPTDWEDSFDENDTGIKDNSEHNVTEYIASERYAMLTLQLVVT